MLIQRMGPDGELRERELNITEEQFSSWELAEATPEEIFTNLSKEDILFFNVGLTPAELETLKSQQLSRRSKYMSSSDLL